MIRTWIADITPLYDEALYRKYYSRLPDFRKEKADRMRFQEGKVQSAGAWSLLQRIRKEYGVKEQAAFNLSHSGDYVLCSVDTGCGDQTQVGCDIEMMKEPNMKVAGRFFCQSECEEILRQNSDAEKSDVFYRFWVLKESFMKATRQGMALDMKSFEIKLGSPPVLMRKPDQFSGSYYYCEYNLGQVPYKAAVCSTEEKIDSEIHTELRFE